MATKTKTTALEATLFAFLLVGAGTIKKDRKGFQAACVTLADNASVCQAARDQLLVASTAKWIDGDNAPNTGMSERGWAALALTIGACSPKSSKTSLAEKPVRMERWLTGGTKPLELKGNGSTRALLTAEQLLVEGISRQFLKGSRKEDCDAAAASAKEQREAREQEVQQQLAEKAAKRAAQKEAAKAAAKVAKNEAPPTVQADEGINLDGADV